jgi:hypothetical protein
MVPDMPFDQLGHQAVQRSAARSNELQNLGTLMLFAQSTLDGF